MPAQWTADIVGEMHLKGISDKQLADAVGVSPEYISMVLNGHREPTGAEEKLRAALERLVAEQNQDNV